MSESIATKLVRLIADYPCAGGDGKFGLEIPEIIHERSYKLLVQHIEFRRKCMNQGFDNLLELLKMHYEGTKGVQAEQHASAK